MLQTANVTCSSVFLVAKGAVAVCESTCFAEPILVYGKGAVINLYNVILDDKLDFDYVAVQADSFKMNKFDEIHLDLRVQRGKCFSIDEDYQRNPDHNNKDYKKAENAKLIEIYEIDRDRL